MSLRKIKKALKNSSCWLTARSMKRPCETSWETKNNSSNCTRFLSQVRTKTLLDYIHGGDEDAIYEAWDFLRRYANNDLIEKYILDNKGGEFFENLQGKFTNRLDEQLKYETFLCRIKYYFICKIQSLSINTEKQEWSKNNFSYGDNLHMLGTILDI